MTSAATPVPLSEAKARLSELARRVRQQHERIALTRNGEAEVVLLSVDDLESLEMTLEILADNQATARISESLAALNQGDTGVDLATVRARGTHCLRPYRERPPRTSHNHGVTPSKVTVEAADQPHHRQVVTPQPCARRRKSASASDSGICHSAQKRCWPSSAGRDRGDAPECS